MRIIQIEALPNGAHENMNVLSPLPLPNGWAFIPDGMEIPDSFPFVDITVEDKVVTTMTAREVPEEEPAPEIPSRLDEIEAQVMYTALETGTLLEVE